jgi:membrane protease YdiL (CAAX protease family)
MNTTSTPQARSLWLPLLDHGQHFVRGEYPLAAALLYLIWFSVAEVLTVLFAVPAGVLLHLLGLFALLLHTAVAWQRGPNHRFLLSLTFIPLIRIVSLALPLAGFSRVYWYLITSIPLFAAAYVVLRLLNFSWRDAGMNGNHLLWQIPVALTGVVLGTFEYFILRPEPLIATSALADLWFPALVLLICTGYLEELIFRRILQRTAIARFGPLFGIAYVAAFFAVLHIGYRSVLDLIFVFAVGLAFGWIVYRTRSLVGVTLAHGLTNIWLFLVIPLWLGAGNVAPALVEPAPIAPVVTGAEVSVEVVTSADTPADTVSPFSPDGDLLALLPAPLQMFVREHLLSILLLAWLVVQSALLVLGLRGKDPLPPEW